MTGRTDLQVLVVEDNPADAFRVREALEEKGRGRFHPVFVGALREAEPRLPASDLVLLDLTLPDSSGADTVARVRAKAPATPVVVLSGERDEDLAFRCLQHGAQDVLLKGAVDGDGLVRALTCALDRQALAGERNEALLRARAAEAELRGVLGAIPEGIVVADPRGRPLFTNAAADRLLGHAPREDMDRRPGRSAPGGGGLDLAIDTVPIRWEGAPAILTTIREAPRRRRRAGGESPLREAFSESEFRDTTKRIAGGIARGLGEQFDAVLEGAFELSDGRDAAAYGPAVRIQRAAWKATGLVRLLLASAGEAKAVPRPVDLSDVVAGAWNRVEEGWPDSIPLVRDLAPGLPRVMADRRLLEQALLTLVEHARASVAAEGGTVTVRTFLDVPAPGRDGDPARDEGIRVGLSVSDSGPALGSGACRRIFEPFYSTDVLGIGAGIGIAPVRGISLQCGGTADVRSDPGRGTTVRLLLPVLEDAEGGKAAGLESLEGEGGFGAPLPRGRETLLVAEGQPWLRWRIQASLQDLGYRVLPAATPGDAVRIASDFRGPIPLLVAEEEAAGMGGAVLAGVLRCRRPGMRALLLGPPRKPDEDGARDAEGLRILRVPFRRPELADAVRSLLDGTTKGPDPMPGPAFPPRSEPAA